MVPADSDRVPRAPPYSGCPPSARKTSRKGLSPAMAAHSSAFRSRPDRSWRPYYPGTASTAPVWAPPLSLATTRGITVVFSSSAYLDVSVQRVRPCSRQVPRSRAVGCPIRTPGDLGPCAPPPGFSQLAASFFASRSLGILHAPYFTSSGALAPGSRRRYTHLYFYCCFSLFCVCHHVKELPLWRMSESNRRPPACRAGALAN